GWVMGRILEGQKIWVNSKENSCHPPQNVLNFTKLISLILQMGVL
ncbi:hypothetical protein HKBW3S06_01387, partial [Candidatus Hakubella thermalkaliphila]